MRHAALILSVAVCVVAVPVARQATGTSLSVSVSSRPLQPGGVVLLTVTGSTSLTSVEGQAFGRQLRFWQSSRDWYALVGADLESKPGMYDVTVSAVYGEGNIASSKTSVTVQPKSFETRRLKVAPQFVNPPATDAERIARDAKLLADTFAQ